MGVLVKLSGIYSGMQFFDSNGSPLSGGKIYTYLQGTTALIPTYSDADGTIERTNPIVLDSSGRMNGLIWLIPDFIYKFSLTNATDTVIQTLENIYPMGAGSGATGGGDDQVFYENDIYVTTDYTISTGKNAGSFGPIIINNGVTVTIPTGSVWSVVNADIDD